MGRMVRKQVYIADRQDQLLKATARETGLTESELIRRAIDEAYDAVAARERRLERWRETQRGMDELGKMIEDSGGIQPWNRDDLYERR